MPCPELSHNPTRPSNANGSSNGSDCVCLCRVLVEHRRIYKLRAYEHHASNPRDSTASSGAWGTPLSITKNGGVLDAVICLSAKQCYAAGVINNSPLHFTYDGSVWTTSTGSSNALYTVPPPTSCATPSFCVSVGPNGQAVIAQSPAAIAQGQVAGSPVNIYAQNPLSGVSCISPIFCMVAAADGHILTYDGSTWSAPISLIDSYAQQAQGSGNGGLTGISCKTSSFCIAVDSNGNAMTFNGVLWSSPSPIDHGTGGELSIACPSTRFCVAVDGSGNTLTFDGSSWGTPFLIDPRMALHAVACPSTSFCVAVGDNGNVVTYTSPN